MVGKTSFGLDLYLYFEEMIVKMRFEKRFPPIVSRALYRPMDPSTQGGGWKRGKEERDVGRKGVGRTAG